MTTGRSSRLRTTLCALAASLALAACGGSSSDERSETSSSQGQDTKRAQHVSAQQEAAVLYDRSFIITDRELLAQIAPDFKLGSLLYAVSRYLDGLSGVDRDDKFFALQPFRAAAKDTEAHNALTDASPEAKIGTVPVIYNTYKNVILANGAFDPDQGVEPFRLIAVVNRLDLAGDFDMRGGGILGGAERRWFGEARLVFAVDRKLPDGSPMPFTVSAEYRLPALKKNINGVIVLDNDFDFAIGPTDPVDWRNRRQLWGQVWHELSSYPLNSQTYLAKLRTILSWVTYGVRFDRDLINASKNAKHNLAFRTGERVRVGLGVGGNQQGDLTNEFEYREFYLNDNWMLSPRKLRREPFDCASKSETLETRIKEDWWTTTNSMAWNYILGDRNLEARELADLTTICGKLPYGQVDDNGDTQFRAKFARFTPSSVWRPRKTVSEAQAHSFALGSCSGCHAGETGAKGFHIGPAADGGAVLSAFLSPQAQPTTVTPRETAYTSNEPERRMKLVARYAAGDPNTSDEPLLYDIDCKHVDVACLRP